VFDSHGNVVRVVYTYYDERKEIVDYVQIKRPDVLTQSMEAVQGSPDIVAERAADVVDHVGHDAQSVSPSRRRIDNDEVEEVDGGRPRWRRTLKKKCMKKCKTKRQRRLRRCKMTRRMVAKGRGRRRTCVRRL
jgi:ribulose 1,5-bisphosphate synthetase/thiazole synthase